MLCLCISSSIAETVEIRKVVSTMNINNLMYNNINSQLDATITNFIDNNNQLNMFRAIISPTLRSTSSLSPAGSIAGALHHKL